MISFSGLYCNNKINVCKQQLTHAARLIYTTYQTGIYFIQVNAHVFSVGGEKEGSVVSVAQQSKSFLLSFCSPPEKVCFPESEEEEEVVLTHI